MSDYEHQDDSIAPEHMLEEFVKQSRVIYKREISQIKYVRKQLDVFAINVTDDEILAELRRQS